MASETRLRTGKASRALIGHLSEYGRLLSVLDSDPGLLVLAADPLSGASEIVRLALEELVMRTVYVDARGALDERDLAMAIADAAVPALRPEAGAWWAGSASGSDLEGLRVHRLLDVSHVDVEGLRLGSATERAEVSGAAGSRQLDAALELAVTLAGGSVLVAIDHLDGLATRSRQQDNRPLATLRAARQRLPDLQLMLIGHTAGPVERALHDPLDPLYRGGQLEWIERTEPARFVADMAIGKSWADAPVETIRVAAELAAGAPACVWSVVDLAADTGGDEPHRTLEAWRRLRALTAAQCARQFDLLRAVHPVAQPVLAAVSCGLGAYSLPLNDGRVRAALNNLRAVGAVWHRRDQRWAVADPLLAAWSREHAPPWVRRRAGTAALDLI
jgi:hypothetical protein